MWRHQYTGCRLHRIRSGRLRADPLGDTPTQVKAVSSSCAADPSYTVGATTDATGDCPTAEYQHMPAQYAEPSTARLCLVPNLLANNCYLMEMPIGLVEKADCTDRGQGVLVQITRRLDVRDQAACPAVAGAYAWPYPAPARTYCTQTVF